MKLCALRVLWPAFLAAGGLEMMVFAVIDPADLHWFNGPALGWSTQAIYTVTFLIFWATTAAASATTSLLCTPPDKPRPLPHSR